MNDEHIETKTKTENETDKRTTTMTTIDKTDDQKLGLTTVTLPAPAAEGSNDNVHLGGIPDTTPFAVHPEFVNAITGALVRHGRRGQQLEDDVPEVQMRTIEAARQGPMPKTLAEWKALGGTIAKRYAIDERRDAKARAQHNVGLCEDPDEHGPLVRASARDPIDTKRYLAVLKELFDSGQMPEMGGEILWGVAEEVTQREIAEETGLTEGQVEYRLKRMRKLFAARIAELGMLVLLVAVGVAVAGPVGGIAVNDGGGGGGGEGSGAVEERGRETPVASTVVRLVTREERAKGLREEAAKACAAGNWEECLARYDEARGLDARGDAEQGVQAARRRAEEGVEDEEWRMSAKPRGR